MLNDLSLSRDDIVVGLAASGTTPFVDRRACATPGRKACGRQGSRTIPHAPLLDEADLGVLLDTGPEVLTGSTRLKAGTAQKMALNRISTAAMVLSGKVVENLMVDVKAKNAKLRDRCVRIVCELTPATRDEAQEPPRGERLEHPGGDRDPPGHRPPSSSSPFGGKSPKGDAGT